MSNDLDLKIRITIEFGSSLTTLLNVSKSRTVGHRLTSRLNLLLKELGLVGQPTVELHNAKSSRAVRVWVHSELQPYSPRLMKRVWKAHAPTDLRNLPETQGATCHAEGFPDAWFKEYLDELDLHNHEPDQELVFEFLAQLVFEVIRERPACLAGPAQVASYVSDVPKQLSSSGPSNAPEELWPVLKALLDLGVSVENKPLVLQTSSVSQQFGRSVEDVVEGAFARLRSSRIEVHIHPQYLQEIISGEPIHEPLSVHAQQIQQSFRELFRSMEEALFLELGIHLPALIWVPSSKMRHGMIAVKINERLSLPTFGLRPSELLVNASVERMAELNVPGQLATNPADGSACAVVSEEHKETAERAGYTTWTLHEFVILTLASEIRRMAYQLLSVEDVEYQLAQLESTFPELILAATKQYSMGDLTRVLRGLVREGLSIRDMRTVLERLLQYDTISIDPNEYVVVDDRFVLDERMLPAFAHSWVNYREFVRSGLKYYIADKYARDHRMSVYLIDSELEARAEEIAMDRRSITLNKEFTESELEAFRDAVWAQVEAVATTAVGPVVLTTSAARGVVRELIASELPNLPVVAYSELPPNINIEPIATFDLRAIQSR